MSNLWICGLNSLFKHTKKCFFLINIRDDFTEGDQSHSIYITQVGFHCQMLFMWFWGAHFGICAF